MRFIITSYARRPQKPILTMGSTLVSPGMCHLEGRISLPPAGTVCEV